MKIGVLQPGYLPWLGFFEQMMRVDLFVLHDDILYTDGDWRNRNRIRTSAGWSWLTVPVKKKNGQLICEAEVDYSTKWQNKHLNLLRENYRTSPYCDEHVEGLRDIIFSDHEKLVDLDCHLIDYFTVTMGITTPTVRTEGRAITGTKTERLINICKEFNADALYEGSAGRDYIDERSLNENGIEIEYQNYKHPKYCQMYEPFIPYLSTLDLLFCHGPESKRILVSCGDRLPI